MRTVLLFALLSIVALPLVRAGEETAAQALARYEAVRLDPKSPQTDAFAMKLGHAIVARHGVALIPLVLDRSKVRGAEEFLLYTPIVLNLPVEDAIGELAKYAKGPDARRAFWARELLIEMETWLGEQRERVSSLLTDTEKK
jgi:hypothetical protein